MILHRLLQSVAERTGPIERAVVTVPAYFNEPRRKATVDAGRMAGLKQVELLNEPTAAALAFGHEMGLFGPEPVDDDVGRNLLIYDLGGGTFDVTVLAVEGRHFRALASDGDVHLGGRDWDERILRYALDSFAKEFGVDLAESAESLQKARVACEEVKRSLSQRQKAVLRIEHGLDRLVLELSQADLEHLTCDLLARTRLTCELAMTEARRQWNELDAVLLVGGASRMPMVGRMIEELSGRAPSRTVAPEQAVALGAALYARMLWDAANPAAPLDEIAAKSRRARITDVTAHSLGIVGFDRKQGRRRVSILIPRNTALPHSNRKRFRTRAAGQKKIVVQVVEGESADPEACTVIGECRLIDLPKDLPENWPVDVTFAYRRDGRVYVEAEVEGSPPLHVEIRRRGALSERELENWASALVLEDESAGALPPSRVHTRSVARGRRRPKRDDAGS